MRIVALEGQHTGWLAKACSKEVPSGDLYEWDPDSTYIQEPTFFKDMSPEAEDL